MFDSRAIAFCLNQFAAGRLDEICNPHRPALGTDNCVHTPSGLRPMTLAEYATEAGVIDALERLICNYRINAIALIACHFFGATTEELAIALDLVSSHAGTELLLESQNLFAEELYRL